MDQLVHQQLLEYYNLSRETDILYRKVADQSGISVAMFWVLYAVCVYQDNCTQSDICTGWMLNKQTVNSALKKLARDGYITLETMESDRRSKWIRLTPQGKKYIETYIRPVLEIEKRSFSAMSDEERTMLLSGSRRFFQLLQENFEAMLGIAQEVSQ